MKYKSIIVCIATLLILIAVLVLSIRYENNTCGVVVGQYMNVDSLPEHAKETLVGYPNIICVFENDAGNPVYVRCNLEGRVVEAYCFNKRYIRNSDWAFMQITQGMDLKNVVQLIGRPIMIGGSGVLQAQFLDSNGAKVRITLDAVYSGSGWDSETRYVTLSPPRRMGADRETYGEIITLPIEKYIIVTVGLLTATIILLRLKKKGILRKKKQSTE